MSENNGLQALRDEGIVLLRSVTRLESIYVTLRQTGLGKLILDAGEIAGSDNLKQLLEQLRHVEQELDWELTSEIVRLKDLCREQAARYSQGRYGVTIGGHIRLPNALPGLPDKLRVGTIAFVDEAAHELRLEGNPVRTDGTLLSEPIAMLLGPDGIKVHVAKVAKQDGLRGRTRRS
jgi:hypothetical protein